MSQQQIEKPLEISDFITIPSGGSETKTYMVPAHWKWSVKKIWIDRVDDTDYTIIIDGKVQVETNVITFRSKKIVLDSISIVIQNNSSYTYQYDILISGSEISR